MRHSFAIHPLQPSRTAAIYRACSAFLGHANVATTQIYIDQSIAHLKAAFNSASMRDKDGFNDALRNQ